MEISGSRFALCCSLNIRSYRYVLSFVFRLCAHLRTMSSSATYIPGPLKNRQSREMGTSKTEFGLLLAALSSPGDVDPLSRKSHDRLTWDGCELYGRDWDGVPR